MKSCLGLIFVLTIFVLVIGGGGLIWYLSQTAEFSRGTSVPPVAIPVRPAAPASPQGVPPVAIPVKPAGHR